MKDNILFTAIWLTAITVLCISFNTMKPLWLLVLYVVLLYDLRPKKK